jgi:hypothetical protein
LVARRSARLTRTPPLHSILSENANSRSSARLRAGEISVSEIVELSAGFLSVKIGEPTLNRSPYSSSKNVLMKNVMLDSTTY